MTIKGKRKVHGPRINDEIKAAEFRLVGGNKQYGVVGLSYAKKMAQDLGLDLVEVSPKADPPVVKLIDYGKFKYDQQKKANEVKKKQAIVQLKEIQFRPNIDQHDLDIKLKRADKFFLQGDKVKMVMQFRGREMAYKETGLERFKNILDALIKLGVIVESEPKMMGNRVIAILAADKKEIAKRQQELQAINNR